MKLSRGLLVQFYALFCTSVSYSRDKLNFLESDSGGFYHSSLYEPPREVYILISGFLVDARICVFDAQMEWISLNFILEESSDLEFFWTIT